MKCSFLGWHIKYLPYDLFGIQSMVCNVLPQGSIRHVATGKQSAIVFPELPVELFAPPLRIFREETRFIPCNYIPTIDFVYNKWVCLIVFAELSEQIRQWHTGVCFLNRRYRYTNKNLYINGTSEKLY